MMCLIHDVINRKSNVPKLKLNSIQNKIHKRSPPKVGLKLSLGGPRAVLVCGHGSITFSPGYQLPATCDTIIKIKRNKSR